MHYHATYKRVRFVKSGLTQLVRLLAILLYVHLHPVASGQPPAWTLRASTGPAPRDRHAMAYDTNRHTVVLFGGVTDGRLVPDTWEWDGQAWSLRSSTGPLPLVGHAMVYDAVRCVTVLFGGDTYVEPYRRGETWEWDGVAWAQRMIAGPPARVNHAMVFDTVRRVVVLFGGGNENGGNGDTWEYNGTSWTRRYVSGPPPLDYPEMAFDTVRGVSVLFGGVPQGTGEGVSGDTWEYDGVRWSLRAVVGPDPRFGHVMCYGPEGGCILFGGHSSTSTRENAETWEWDGGVWRQLQISGPSPRRDHAMVFDSARSVVVLFGGNWSASPAPNLRWGDTWELSLPCTGVPPVITSSPIAQSCCVGTTASLTVSATGIEPLSFQWRRGNPPTAIPHALQSMYTITTFAPSDADRYDCVVTDRCGSAISAPATLALCPPDFNCSGMVSVQDIFDFLAAYCNGEFGADFNGSRNLSVQDLFDFLAAFFAGCG